MVTQLFNARYHHIPNVRIGQNSLRAPDWVLMLPSFNFTDRFQLL
jgi:hypothetical protein